MLQLMGSLVLSGAQWPTSSWLAPGTTRSDAGRCRLTGHLSQKLPPRMMGQCSVHPGVLSLYFTAHISISITLSHLIKALSSIISTNPRTQRQQHLRASARWSTPCLWRLRGVAQEQRWGARFHGQRR